MTPEGERLDRHLQRTIADFSSRQTDRDHTMRGIQRLANASGNLMQKADQIADEAAGELEAAYAKHIEVAAKYKAFAAEVRKSADQALDNLNQLSNLPTPDSGDSKKPE